MLNFGNDHLQVRLPNTMVVNIRLTHCCLDAATLKAYLHGFVHLLTLNSKRCGENQIWTTK